MGSWKKFTDNLPMSDNMPMDPLPASNGEFIPPPPTSQQLAIQRLQNEEGERQRRRLGMSRREFVRTSGALGVGLWSVGQVMPGRIGQYTAGAAYGATPAMLQNVACDLRWPEAQLNNLPGEFIFDVQSHHIDSAGAWRVNNPGFHAVFASIWEQSGPLGGMPSVDENQVVRGWGKGGEIDPIENLSRYHYLKELFLDSSTNMTVLSAVPAEESQQPLPIGEAAQTVGAVNALAGGTPRTVMHSFVMPNRGSHGITGHASLEPVFMEAEFEMMQKNFEMYGDQIRGWKVYTPWGDVPMASGWFLDDAVGMRFLEQVRKLHHSHGAPAVIACHKGFALPAFDQRAASPRDIGPAARRNRDISFIVYHSGFDGEYQGAYPGDDNVNSADRGVDCFVKSLRENSYDARRFVKPGLEHGNVPNVFAEIGATFRSLASDPDQVAHMLGKLITYVGPQRVVWGTDSLWFGSPQPEIAALRSLEFSDEAKEFYNLPHGLNGDRFDPTKNALNPFSYGQAHPAVDDWPTDVQQHPERSIRNGIFGRNAAVPYKVDPDAVLKAIACDDVQKIRDAYLLNPATPAIGMAPGASNTMPAPRTRRGLLKTVWPHAQWLP
jgi:predicted TIM-barrel fold metal-dependent hydrolase